MAKNEYDLAPAELEVLAALWEAGTATVRDVMNLLHAKGRQLAYTTVLTFLSRLEQKGVVRSDKSGLAYVYRAKVSRNKIVRNRIRTLMQQLFDGAAGPLVLELIRSEQFTSDEIEQMHALIDTLDTRQNQT
jgi:predicted transcriptional regulator